MESHFPRTKSHPVTEEGKAIHWAAEGVLRSWGRESPTAPYALTDMLGKACPENGVVLTEEMINAGNVYLAAVWERAQHHIDGLGVELQLSAVPAGLQQSGRADAVWVSADRTELVVWDGKFGYGPVAAFENWQLAIYGVAAAFPYRATIQRVTLVIVQPRGESVRQPVKTWIIEGAELSGVTAMLIERHGYTQLDAAAPLAAGKHCRNCRAESSCSVNREATWHVRASAGAAMPENLSPEEIAYELEEFARGESLIRGRRIALEALAQTTIERGGKIPGYVMHQSLADRSWRSPEQAKLLGPGFGVEMEERKTISPAQAQSRGMSEAAVNALTVRATRPPKLVRERL